MPDLQRVRDAYRDRGVEVIGIGIDSAAKIAAFRDSHQLTLPLLVAGAGGSDLYRALGNSAAALPYTVLIGPDGSVRERHLGQVKPEAVAPLAGRSLAPGPRVTAGQPEVKRRQSHVFFGYPRLFPPN